MNLIIKNYENNQIKLQLSSFSNAGGITEYHALLSVLDPMLTFEKQTTLLLQAYQEMFNNELPTRAVAVFRRYFLSDAANQHDFLIEREKGLFQGACSVVQQPPMNGTKIALWVYLQTEMTVRSHRDSFFETSHNGYRHLWYGGAFNKAANSEYQTRLLLNNYIMLLSEQGCKLSDHCVRTWFFVQNVDVNYSGVVKARKEVFVTQGLTEETHYISSTGIEGRHADPDVFVEMDAYAIAGMQPEQMQYLYAPTHLNPTYEYGVTFERGTTITYGDRKHLFISGTASINNRGEIVHPGDILQQTARMMENIAVLLKEGGADTKDIVQALVYLRDPSDYQVVSEYFRTHYPEMPYLIVLGPVCRPGWLIETECIAVTDAGDSRFMAF
ncbi:Rid family hydrolase [Parabacteroides sp. PF5-9]|uniref:Rid family hydrolase n=1 Tax=Parabacteroides sp. PF5-9 TaxID=1742404 RepID=UPI0024763742|nr:Rid family hydrolase [Parabacteroides sp. PF5-9]